MRAKRKREWGRKGGKKRKVTEFKINFKIRFLNINK